MTEEDLVLIVTADLVSQVRGRAFGADQLSQRLHGGVGWVPANLAITAFGELEEPNIFGAIGDLRLQPDVSATIRLPPTGDHPGIRVMLADTVNLDLSPWSCCPRNMLRRTLDALKSEFGLTLHATFEHEFTLLDHDGSAMTRGGPSFSLAAMMYFEPFGSKLYAALAEADFEPDTWLAEFGPNQFEITLAPCDGLVAADRALLLRELVRDLAKRSGWRASFSPLVAPQAIGNGVHVHFSLRDENGSPVLYDAAGPSQLSVLGGSFAAGILEHSRAVCALTAPSVISYLRMRPHTWSAGHAVLGLRNREEMLRICPTVGASNIEQQFNLEFRAADATANPWLVMTAIVLAGLDGLRAGLHTPTVVTEDFNDWTEAERSKIEIAQIPTSLGESLLALVADHTFTDWLGKDFVDTYVAIKQRELASLYGATDETTCKKYVGFY